VGETTPSELRDREQESERERDGCRETPLSREPLREQNSGVQTQPVVSSPTQTLIASTVIEKTTGPSPPSFTGVVYSSTPFALFYPPNSVSPVPSSVQQHLQFQQSTSVTPVVAVESLMHQSHALPFSTVTTPSSNIYVPPPAHQLPFRGGQGQLTFTGSNQPFSLSASDQISADSSALLKRVSVPKFFGQKKNYEAWKAAFYSCVDRTRATPEYKLLRLRG